jgi:lipoprotein-anchoring transpeptidase ErfK/SrfK
MNIRKSALSSASLLAVASAMLWFGSALAAPLPPTYPDNSASLFASLMRDDAPAQEIESDVVLAPNLRRQVVNYPTAAAAGTIVIDTAQTYLYYILGDNKAIRYGIGVGRDGFTWSGSQAVTRMAEWPDWTPPQEMIVRQPYLPRWMAGGEGNPLGARAIYLGSTVYRIHGTNAPATIGTRVSSGCIRLTNTDVIDLYRRVVVGTKIVVLPIHGQPAKAAPSAVPIRVAAPRTSHLRPTGIY